MKPEKNTRPWGSFITFTKNEESTVKLLNIKDGEEFSLQYHKNREEFWKVISGKPKITIGEETFVAEEGSEFFVPKETKHRVSATSGDVVILEISRGHFDEEDIVRLEDKYNRV